jgi:hypothetical protein
MIQHDDAVGQDERVVVGERVDPGAQLDVPRAFGRGSDEHLRAGDQFTACRVVLADPRFGVAQSIEVLDQLQVAMQGQCGVDPGLVHRWQEHTEPERFIERLELGHPAIVAYRGNPPTSPIATHRKPTGGADRLDMSRAGTAGNAADTRWPRAKRRLTAMCGGGSTSRFE